MNRISLLFIASLIFILISACNKDDDKTPIANVDCNTATFAATIFPLLESKCGNASCHGAGSSVSELINYDQIKVYADNGGLEDRVLDEQDMPQGGSMTSEQLGELKCWLDAGAPNN